MAAAQRWQGGQGDMDRQGRKDANIVVQAGEKPVTLTVTFTIQSLESLPDLHNLSEEAEDTLMLDVDPPSMDTSMDDNLYNIPTHTESRPWQSLSVLPLAAPHHSTHDFFSKPASPNQSFPSLNPSVPGDSSFYARDGSPSPTRNCGQDWGGEACDILAEEMDGMGLDDGGGGGGEGLMMDLDFNGALDGSGMERGGEMNDGGGGGGRGGGGGGGGQEGYWPSGEWWDGMVL